MGLFKKKDGSPTLFGKITKTVAGVAGVAASVLPIPAGGLISKVTTKVSDVIGKANDVVENQSGGLLSIGNLQQKENEQPIQYIERLKGDLVQSAGGAVAGFANASNTDASKNDSPKNQFVKGATKTTIGKYTWWIVGGLVATIAGILIFKKK